MALKSNKAFSLLEVIITVAILSTAIVFVFRAFTTVLSSVKFSQNITLACFLAEDKLWRIENNFALTDEAQPEKPEEKFRFDFTKENIPELSILKELTLAVSWEEKRANPYSLQFATYILSKETEE